MPLGPRPRFGGQDNFIIISVGSLHFCYRVLRVLGPPASMLGLLVR